MVDCSHGNSSKQHIKQMEVGKSIVRDFHFTASFRDTKCSHSSFALQREQLEGSETAANIMGVMIESHLNEGKQSMPAEGPSGYVAVHLTIYIILISRL
jgi:3-deoxy-7-phosphoheptulonate synthase